MATAIAQVKVTPVEGGHDEGRGGYVVTCSHCPNYRTIRTERPSADLAAQRHQREHVTPDPRDQVYL